MPRLQSHWPQVRPGLSFIWSHAVVPSRIRQSFRLPMSYQSGFGRVGLLLNRRNALGLSCRLSATPGKGRLQSMIIMELVTPHRPGCQDPDPTCTITEAGKVEDSRLTWHGVCGFNIAEWLGKRLIDWY